MEITIDDTVLNGDTEQWLVQFVKDVLWNAGVNTQHETMRIYEYTGKRVYLVADGHEIDDLKGDYTIRTWDYKITPKSKNKLEGKKYNANKQVTPKGGIKLSERVTWTLFKQFPLPPERGHSAGKELANGVALITFKIALPEEEEE